MMQYDANKKSMVVAYVLWFFVGMLGAHRFYLGQTGSGVALLVLTLGSILLMFAFVGFLTIWIPAIWVFIDLFLIPGMVSRSNTDLANRLSQRAG